MIDMNAPENYVCMCRDFGRAIERVWQVEYPSGRTYSTPARCEHEAKTLANLRFLPSKPTRLKARVIA